MTRCPNCGSAVRIGAKFCTSCGFRLAVDETAVSPAQTQTITPSRSPFATTSSPAWRAESDPVETPSAVVAPEPVVEAAWSASASDASEDEDDDEAGHGSTPVSSGAGLDAGNDEDDVVAAAGGGDDNDAPGRSWFAPAPPDTSGPISDDMIASLEGDAQPPSDQVDLDVSVEADRSIEPSGAVSTEAAADPDREVIFVSSIGTLPADTSDSTTGAEVEQRTPSGSSAPTSPVRSDGPLDEARSLVARLSDLLSSGSFAGASPGGDAAGVSLESIADQADVDALRAVVASAQGRPRDVDVMLDLVLRADTIAAVIADRDLLLAALRGDEAAVEEAWPAPTNEGIDDEPSTYPAWGTP